MKIGQKIKERKTELSLDEKSIDDRDDFIEPELSEIIAESDGFSHEEWEIEIGMYDATFRDYLSE